MIYKLEMRWDSESDWVEEGCGSDREESRWDNPSDAYHAFVATVERWPTLTHRLLRCDDNGYPLAVVAIIDYGRLEDEIG